MEVNVRSVTLTKDGIEILLMLELHQFTRSDVILRAVETEVCGAVDSCKVGEVDIYMRN